MRWGWLLEPVVSFKAWLLCRRAERDCVEAREVGLDREWFEHQVRCAVVRAWSVAQAEARRHHPSSPDWCSPFGIQRPQQDQ